MKNKIIVKKISADRFTPLIVFKKLKGIVLLESAVLEIGKSRYSIIQVEEEFKIVLDDEGVIYQQNGQRKLLSKDKNQLLEILKKYGRQRIQKTDLTIPIPYAGIGYLSYETARLFDEINFAKQEDNLKVPEAIFSFGSVFVIFDHYKDELHVIALGLQNQEQILNQKVEKITEKLLDNDFRAYQVDEKTYPYQANLEKDKKSFIAEVKNIKAEIVKGNLLQGVLSHCLQVKTKVDPLEAYRRLRRENPSPYLFFLNFGDFKLFGSSPEVMVKLSGNVSVIKPIAGTRPRGKDMAEDLRLEQELLADEKERAEHLMLVDLARNDLGRTAQKGTVTVKASYFIERYSQVMHIVSEVEAILDKKYDVYDLIKTTFPAGTVSGAPKIKAIEIISALEKYKRGPYAGLVGYFDINGDFDSCITIRSVVYKDNNYYIQVGAGIVYDSIPEKEFQETINKAKAMIKALGVDIK